MAIFRGICLLFLMDFCRKSACQMSMGDGGNNGNNGFVSNNGFVPAGSNGGISAPGYEFNGNGGFGSGGLEGNSGLGSGSSGNGVVTSGGSNPVSGGVVSGGSNPVSGGFNGNYGSSGNSGLSSNGNVGYPSNGNSGYPSNGNSEFPSNGNSGVSSNGNVGYPSNFDNGYGSSGSFVPANQRNCQVASVEAQKMFNMDDFQGSWRVVKRTSQASVDPGINSFLEIFSNSAFFKTKMHSMRASMYPLRIGGDKVMVVAGTSTREMSIFGINFEFCQEIPALYLSARDPRKPGQFSMRFQTEELGLGFDMDLSAVLHGVFGKNFFEFYVLSTDYQNYAVIWNCKRVLPDGSCGENVVLVLSRGKGLSAYQEQLVKAKLATICIDYKDLEDEPQISTEC